MRRLTCALCALATLAALAALAIPSHAGDQSHPGDSPWRISLSNRAAIAIDPEPDGSGFGGDPQRPARAAAVEITYGGGEVLHASRTHAIFWAPQGSGLTFDPGYVALVERFFADVAADSHMTTNAYAITGEYTDARGPAAYASTDAGSVTDGDSLPPNGCTEPATGPRWGVCLTDLQLQHELEHLITVDRLPAGGDNIYFLITPSGFGSCTDSGASACALGGAASGYCGYHASTVGGVLYAVIPYNAVSGHCQSSKPRPNANTADPVLSTISHEQGEMVTDPYGDAWTDANGNEIGDACLRTFGRALGGSGALAWNERIHGHGYWLQELYSRLQGGCEPRARPDSVSIAGPTRVTAGAATRFTGSGRQPGGTVSAYNWSFGDGVLRSGRVVTHTYARAGTYRLRLRIVDAAGNWAFAARTVAVTRAP